MSGKHKERDRLFSLLVRTRAAWRCERCTLQLAVGSAALHCSHFEKRRHLTLRWHPDNAEALCQRCHAKLEQSPSEMRERHRGRLTSEEYTNLITRKHSGEKYSGADLKRIELRLASQWYAAEVAFYECGSVSIDSPYPDNGGD